MYQAQYYDGYKFFTTTILSQLQWLAFYSHVKNTCTTESFHRETT